MTQLSDYLRLPPRDAVRLVRDGAETSDGEPVNDELLALCDAVNAAVLAALEQAAPGPGFRLAFVRGSFVQNRVQVARIWWPAVVEMLGLDSLAADLGRSFGATPVEDTLQEIHRRGTEALIRHRHPLGPAKLLIRLRVPDRELWSSLTVPQIEAFVERMGERGRNCDETTAAVLGELGSRVSLDLVRAQLPDQLARFGLESHAAIATDRFEEIVGIAEAAKCLHPFLPLDEGVIRETARRLALSPAVARQLICLLRFTWVAGLEGAENLSDFSIKGVLVVPRELESATATGVARAQQALHAAVASHPDLKRFRQRFPGVQIQATLLTLPLPGPVYRVFAEDDSLKARLRLVPVSYMGHDYFTHFVRDQSRRVSGAPLPEGGGLQGVTTHRVRTTTERDDPPDRTEVPPRNISPTHVRRLLVKAIEGEGDKYLDKCQALFRKIQRRDFVGNLRGVWSLTPDTTR